MACIAPPNSRPGVWIAFVAATLAALACAPRVPPGTPEPDFKGSFESVPPASILAYLRKLDFDRRDGAGDEQPLVVGTCPQCRIGPKVALQPEKKSYRNSEKDLAGTPGRIVARLINRDKKEGYPMFNLGPQDTVYWAVYGVERVSDSLLEGRSLFISHFGLLGKRDTIALPRDLYIEEHPGEPDWGQPLARWIEYDVRKAGGAIRKTQFSIMSTWNTCKSGACCH